MKAKYIKVSIIGAGATGKVIGRLLQKAGYKIHRVASRNFASTQKAVRFIGAGESTRKYRDAVKDADVIFITTSDDAIESVCRKLSKERTIKKGAIVLHCSGNYSSNILRHVRSSGAYVASLHPLRSLANVENSFKNFDGTFCGYEGDKMAQPVVEKIIKDIRGVGLKVKSNSKPLYHSSAVFVSNYLATLIEIGFRLFEICGIKKKDAKPALIALACGTIDNIERVGLPDALTGPIERGDLGTLEVHLKSLNKNYPTIAKIYSLLGKIAVEIALKKGSITNSRARKLNNILKTGVKKHK